MYLLSFITFHNTFSWNTMQISFHQSKMSWNPQKILRFQTLCFFDVAIALVMWHVGDRTILNHTTPNTLSFHSTHCRFYIRWCWHFLLSSFMCRNEMCEMYRNLFFLSFTKNSWEAWIVWWNTLIGITCLLHSITINIYSLLYLLLAYTLWPVSCCQHIFKEHHRNVLKNHLWAIVTQCSD